MQKDSQGLVNKSFEKRNASHQARDCDTEINKKLNKKPTTINHNSFVFQCGFLLKDKAN
jgi:hypothetical protein